MKYLLLLLTLFITSCTDNDSAREALKDAGYKEPYKIGGYGFAECSQGDVYATRFKAWNVDSTRQVSGCVCSGWFKGKTIRLD